MDKAAGGIVAVLILIAIGFGLWYFLRKKPEGRPCPCGHYGDLDGDGRVTMKDYDLLGGHLLGVTLEPWQVERADVDGNGVINVFDWVTLRSYIEGTIDTFPVCGV